jgi:hypothetical protein
MLGRISPPDLGLETVDACAEFRDPICDPSYRAARAFVRPRLVSMGRVDATVADTRKDRYRSFAVPFEAFVDVCTRLRMVTVARTGGDARERREWAERLVARVREGWGPRTSPFDPGCEAHRIWNLLRGLRAELDHLDPGHDRHKAATNSLCAACVQNLSVYAPPPRNIVLELEEWFRRSIPAIPRVQARRAAEQAAVALDPNYLPPRQNGYDHLTDRSRHARARRSQTVTGLPHTLIRL